MTNHNTGPQTFALGRIVMTPGAATAFTATGDRPFPLLARHQRGDWDEASPEDATENDVSVTHGLWILSASTLKDGTPIGILTEAACSATTRLLPNED